MKKIVVGITAPGSVLLLDGQLRYFKELGYKTYLLAPNHPRVIDYCNRESCEHLPIDIEREISFFKDLKSLFMIFKHFIRIKPDIINLGTPKVSLLGMFAAKCLRINNRVYTCRGIRFEDERGAKRMILKLMEKLTASLSNKIICISESVRTLGLDNNLFKKNKTVVINKGSSNGINLNRFNISSVDIKVKEKKREEIGLEKGDFVFGFVGRIVDAKGIKELYLAFNRLYSKNENLKLLLVGPIENKQISDMSLVKKIQNHKGIVLVGSQLDVPLYMAMMDVFVLPTWREGFGNVTVEAAAMGLPVISNDITGIRDSVSNNFNGILIKVKDVTELMCAMKLLYNNCKLRNKLGANGKEWSKNFERKIIWEGIDSIYKK
jgi:glycosyltransferase involved in cell wall biosynthesis